MKKESRHQQEDGESHFLAELYWDGYAQADDMAKQLLGPEADRELRRAVIQKAFMRLACRVERLECLNTEERMRQMRIAVRDTVIEEGRKRSKAAILNGSRYGDRKPQGGQMAPRFSDMLDEETDRDYRYLYAALARLEIREFHLLIERYQNGLSDQDIGKKLGIKTRNVRIYMARARRKVTMYYYEEEAANG